jgi:hypothetical protein
VRWYKHYSDMIDDPKVRRLVRKHGAEAYAVYNLVIERIVRRMDTASPLPDLEEQAEDIADMLRMDTAKVQDIMWHCIELQLFDQDQMTGRILAHKIYKFLATSETRSKEIREMIAQYRASQIVTDNRDKYDRIEKNRIEEKREEEERVSIGSHFTVTRSQWAHFNEKHYPEDVRKMVDKMNDWIDAKHGGRSPYKDYAAALRQWIKKDQNACPERLTETKTMWQQAQEGKW